MAPHILILCMYLTTGSYFREETSVDSGQKGSLLPCPGLDATHKLVTMLTTLVQTCPLLTFSYTRSVRKVSDRIFLCEHLMDYNLARLHEPTLNLSAHA